MPVVAMIYELFCAVVRLLVLRGRCDRSKDVEILVLRKQLEVLGRQVLHPRLEDGDRMVLAGLSRVLNRRAWAMFLVIPRPVTDCSSLSILRMMPVSPLAPMSVPRPGS